MKSENQEARESETRFGINGLERSQSPKNVLNALFSKQFLGNLKNELNQKAKSNNNIAAHETVESIKSERTSKIEKQMMAKKIKQLTRENQELLKKVKQLTKMTSKSVSEINIYKPKILQAQTIPKLRIHSHEVSISLYGSRQMNINKQIEKLQYKIQQLQASHMVKDSRLSELQEKEVLYDGQIKLLKTKSKTLQCEVQGLRESIKIQFSQLEKPIRMTNISERSQSPQRIDTTLAGQLRDKLTSSILGVTRKSDNLLASNCFNLEVPEDYHLSQIETKKLSKVEEVNEIDNLLEDELNCISSIDLSVSPQDRVNNNLNFKLLGIRQIQSNSQENNNKTKNINSSMVMIQINSSPPQTSNQITQSLVSINF